MIKLFGFWWVFILTSMKNKRFKRNKTDFFLIIKHFNLVPNCWRSITRHRTYRSRLTFHSLGTFVFVFPHRFPVENTWKVSYDITPSKSGERTKWESLIHWGTDVTHDVACGDPYGAKRGRFQRQHIVLSSPGWCKPPRYRSAVCITQSYLEDRPLGDKCWLNL